MMQRREFLEAAAMAAGGLLVGDVRLASASPAEGRFLYVATPGIRNYVEYGGIGVLVFDMDQNYRLVRRIPTFDVRAGEAPENVKGIAASAITGRLYVTTHKRLASFDLATDRIVWSRDYAGGCDRLAIAPDGKLLYVPSFEGPHWHVLDALSGDVVTTIVTGSGAHNTIYGPDGRHAYLAGLKSPTLNIADTRTHKVVQTLGPFSNMIRPFTINAAETLCFVNVNDLLGFEIGDIKTGKMLHRVTVAGYEKGPVKRHGCPSHGIGLTPDEKELWLADGPNARLHIFDATAMPPRQVATVPLRDQPGWVTFSLDGKSAYPSTGEVIDTASRKIVATLADEQGGPVQSEKVVEVAMAKGKPVRTGDQFGIGRRPR
jgi:DNA-binding beta-propeller fold protein YncE